MEENKSSEKILHILHFSNVYNLIEREKEPVGGAARFITAAEKYVGLNPLVLFSGDIFSPSRISQVMKGKQMIPFLDRFKIHAATLGNHDLDFGVERFVELKNWTSFPWVLSNVKDPEESTPLGEAVDHIILTHEGIKIGIIGLSEPELLENVSALEDDDYAYEDFVKSARNWCAKLRKNGWEIIIALTHMNLANDK